jgi:hypothetical protein
VLYSLASPSDRQKKKAWFPHHIIFVMFSGNMTGATSGAGIVSPPAYVSWPLVFSRFCVAQSLAFCVMFCRSLYILFLLAMVLSVDQFYLVSIDFINSGLNVITASLSNYKTFNLGTRKVWR